ncbi:hypothetical protein V6N13_000299 [Hibiscus sabdariffa]
MELKLSETRLGIDKDLLPMEFRKILAQGSPINFGLFILSNRLKSPVCHPKLYQFKAAKQGVLRKHRTESETLFYARLHLIITQFQNW